MRFRVRESQGDKVNVGNRFRVSVSEGDRFRVREFKGDRFKFMVSVGIH